MGFINKYADTEGNKGIKSEPSMSVYSAFRRSYGYANQCSVVSKFISICTV